MSTQGKLLAERDYEGNQLRQARDAAERTIKELRDELALTSSGSWPALDKLKSEKAAVEEQLRVTRDERAKLQRDINAIQQQAESSWATERMENALLRERINDIAAEVAKLAIQLEGPNSPIEALLAAEPAKPANGAVERHRAPWQPGRRRRHARGADPRAAIPRLPRPPAGGVTGFVRLRAVRHSVAIAQPLPFRHSGARDRANPESMELANIRSARNGFRVRIFDAPRNDGRR